MPRQPDAGLGWAEGVKNATNQNVDPTLQFDVYEHHLPILYHLATMYNAVDTADRRHNLNRLAM